MTGEADDVVKASADFPAGHAEDCAVEIDVFAAGEFAVQAGIDLDEGGESTRGCVTQVAHCHNSIEYRRVTIKHASCYNGVFDEVRRGKRSSLDLIPIDD